MHFQNMLRLTSYTFLLVFKIFEGLQGILKGVLKKYERWFRKKQCFFISNQNQPFRGVLHKRCSKNLEPAPLFFKIETPDLVVSCIYYKIFKKSFFADQLRMTTTLRSPLIKSQQFYSMNRINSKDIYVFIF